VIRPVQNPQLASALIAVPDAEDLRRRLQAAAADLRACAAWYVQLKKARRRAGITTGSPQDLYFQRAFELARSHGMPQDAHAAIAAAEVAEVHDRPDRVTAAQLRDYLSDPSRAAQLRGLIDRAWDDRAQPAPRPDAAAGLAEALASCAAGGADSAFSDLVASSAGTASARGLAAPGAARELGLSDRETLARPGVGSSASKSAMPVPFDRSILERLFVGIERIDLTDYSDGGADPLGVLVTEEIARSAGGWQLAAEPSRVTMLVGRDASATLGEGGAVEHEPDVAARLRGRWEREPFVRRSLRLPAAESETGRVREAFLRRLWVRLHGRELRGEPVDGRELWDLLDGALRSVILDRRDRVKTSLARRALSAGVGGEEAA
jgi:hypothetical protein